MRARIVLALLASSVFAVAVAARIVPNQGNAPDPRPAADLKWVDLDPTGAPGVKVATLWGDHQKGAFGVLFKLPAGFTAPLHTHTHSMKLVIVSGTYIQAPEGKPEFRLGPGSYLMQPGGSYRHVTRCDESAECVFFVEGDGAFDLHPATGGNAPS